MVILGARGPIAVSM